MGQEVGGNYEKKSEYIRFRERDGHIEKNKKNWLKTYVQRYILPRAGGDIYLNGQFVKQIRKKLIFFIKM